MRTEQPESGTSRPPGLERQLVPLQAFVSFSQDLESAAPHLHLGKDI
jgi:hypothetical protein